MRSSLKAQLERLAPIQTIDRVKFGSVVDLVLRPIVVDSTDLNAIAATLALAKRGITMLRAKRAVEAVLGKGATWLKLPAVDDVDALIIELRDAGLSACTISDTDVDVRAIRRSLDLTQEQFAQRFNIDISALQNWEQGRCTPDRTARSYFRVIQRNPSEAGAAQETPRSVQAKTPLDSTYDGYRRWFYGGQIAIRNINYSISSGTPAEQISAPKSSWLYDDPYAVAVSRSMRGDRLINRATHHTGTAIVTSDHSSLTSRLSSPISRAVKTIHRAASHSDHYEIDFQ